MRISQRTYRLTIKALRMKQFKVYDPRTRKFSPVKHTLKFLSFCQDPQIQREVLSRAPPEVIKALCNAALNVQRGEVTLSAEQKRILGRHRLLISKLVELKLPLERKRKLLVQRGGGPILAAIIPILLSSVFSSLGSLIFKRK